MSDDDRDLSLILVELGGVDYDEAEAVVQHLDRGIRIWSEMLEQPEVSERDREIWTGIVTSSQRRRRLWAEIAALDHERQEDYERRLKQ